MCCENDFAFYQTNHRGSITIQMYTVSHTYDFIYIYEMCEIPNSTSCLWPSPGCLPPPLQPCAGDCPRWADGCSPLSRSAPSKVHFFSFAFSVYVRRCLMSDVFFLFFFLTLELMFLLVWLIHRRIGRLLGSEVAASQTSMSAQQTELRRQLQRPAFGQFFHWQRSVQAAGIHHESHQIHFG